MFMSTTGVVCSSRSHFIVHSLDGCTWDKGAGDRATGDKGAGDRATGDRATGDKGAGDRATGYRGGNIPTL